ncbi:FBD-associated F-box protein At3g52670-like [Rosa chinensis]|uniref:FBD-associated F-box protein At3g52670-like n=1 Tax=Rosa chinensis TaxID=74649 RepID=UPI001AD9277E|nr:FBD-associated F-box protein At3g52670-like [Rosa chinensis]
MDIEFDNLSDLPSDVTEKILSFLPMKEAVRTSILSSKWRYKWAILPDLVFDELGFPGVLYKHDKLVKMVDHVLFLLIGPINKVKLSHKGLNGTADIDRWILHLSRNSMREFIFRFWKKPEYKMPSCAFEDLSFQNTLKLTGICISLEANGDQRPVPGGSSNLLKLLTQCAHVQGLDIQNYFLNVRQEGQALVGGVNSWLDDNQNFQLRKLQIVEVHGISSTKAGLDFIKFLLLNSPMLEKVFCKPASHYSSPELLKKMIQFKRSSSLAEIIYLAP